MSQELFSNHARQLQYFRTSPAWLYLHSAAIEYLLGVHVGFTQCCSTVQNTWKECRLVGHSAALEYLVGVQAGCTYSSAVLEYLVGVQVGCTQCSSKIPGRSAGWLDIVLIYNTWQECRLVVHSVVLEYLVGVQVGCTQCCSRIIPSLASLSRRVRTLIVNHMQ